MRILDINNLYSPTGGGIRVYHHKKLQWFHDRGMENILIYPSMKNTDTRDFGGRIIGIRSPRLGSSGYNFLVRGKPLLELVEKLSPDVIELGSGIVVPGMIREYLERIPSYAYYHSNWPEALPLSVLGIRRGPFSHIFKRFAEPRMGRGYAPMKKVMGASEYSLNRLREAGLTNLAKVQLGADPNMFRPERRSDALRKSLGIKGKTKMVLYMGRLAPEKGILIALDAFEILLKRSDIVLVVAGRGHWKGKLHLTAKKHPERLKVVGPTAHSHHAAELMASADAYIAAGPCETFSLASLEALDSGTPVAACREAAAAELVEQAGGNAIYKPWYSPEALAEAILEAIETPAGKRGDFRAYAEQRTWERCFESILSIYET